MDRENLVKAFTKISEAFDALADWAREEDWSDWEEDERSTVSETPKPKKLEEVLVEDVKISDEAVSFRYDNQDWEAPRASAFVPMGFPDHAQATKAHWNPKTKSLYLKMPLCTVCGGTGENPLVSLFDQPDQGFGLCPKCALTAPMSEESG